MAMAGHRMIMWLVVEILLNSSFLLWSNSPVLVMVFRLLMETMYTPSHLLQV